MRRYNLVSLGGDALCMCGHRRTMHIHGRCEVVGCQCGADARLWPHHADGTPFARLCRAEHLQGFDCELEAGHDGPHRYTSGGSNVAWSEGT